MASPINLLFLCTGNSCRSQMAEGWLRHLWPEHFSAYSAGIETHGLNPNAVAVMQEIGIDISGHRSQLVTDLEAVSLDIVISVCGHADEHCPVFPGQVQRIHAPFDDPPRLAADIADPEAALDVYRRVRDDIGNFVRGLPTTLGLQS